MTQRTRSNFIPGIGARSRDKNEPKGNKRIEGIRAPHEGEALGTAHGENTRKTVGDSPTRSPDTFSG